MVTRSRETVWGHLGVDCFSWTYRCGHTSRTRSRPLLAVDTREFLAKAASTTNAPKRVAIKILVGIASSPPHGSHPLLLLLLEAAPCASVELLLLMHGYILRIEHSSGLSLLALWWIRSCCVLSEPPLSNCTADQCHSPVSITAFFHLGLPNSSESCCMHNSIPAALCTRRDADAVDSKILCMYCSWCEEKSLCHKLRHHFGDTHLVMDCQIAAVLQSRMRLHALQDNLVPFPLSFCHSASQCRLCRVV